MCGTGIIDAVALMVELGVVDETGRLLDADEVDEELRPLVGDEDGGNVFYLTGDRTLYITQTDVRNLQLAKGAIRAGIFTMLDAQGLRLEDVCSVQIAGGFGEYLDLESAARVGLFPRELLECASSVGNTSIEGASALLLSRAAGAQAQRIASTCTYLELSGNAFFNASYIEQMEF